MIDNSALPNHLGIILDGNRRWAKKNGFSALEGHKKGAEVFRDIVLACFEYRIPYVSAFVFSTENWQRTQEEVSYLMSLVLRVVEKYLDEFHEKGIKIVVLGSRKGLDKKVIKALDQTIDKTSQNTSGTVALCFNYGGKTEIIDAIKSVPVSEIQALNPEGFEQYLYSKDLPPVDMIIRTSGEQRLSGFMMWHAEYAELLFLDKYWPDFSVNDLGIAIEEYKNRKRRHGK